ncbi:MAG: hypothetical protein WCK39_00060 [Methanomassiliicoccales archaeon]
MIGAFGWKESQNPADSLCDALNSMGIAAIRIGKRDPAAFNHTRPMAATEYPDMFMTVGLIKVEGRNVDVVELGKTMMGGGSHPRSPPGWAYGVFYLIRKDMGDLADQYHAEFVPSDRSPYQGGEGSWTGTDLATKLNADDELRNLMMEKWSEGLKIKGYEKDGCIVLYQEELGRAKKGAIITAWGVDDRPSRAEFEIMDRIAFLVKDFVPTRHDERFQHQETKQKATSAGVLIFVVVLLSMPFIMALTIGFSTEVLFPMGIAVAMALFLGFGWWKQH